MAKNDTNNTQAMTTGGPDMDFLRSLGMGALDNLSQKDIIMPRYKLVKNTSKKGTPGKWVSNVSDTEYDYIEMAILGIGNYQIMFPPQGEGDKPLCRSNDGTKKASADGLGDGACANCRYNVWTKDANGNSVPPKCRSGYTLLGFVFNPDGTYNVGIVSIKGSSMKTAKQYFTKMRTLGIAPFAYLTKLTSVSTVNSKGRFYQSQLDFSVDPQDKAHFFLPENIIKELADQSKNYAQFLGTAAMIDDEMDEGEKPLSQGAQDFMNTLGQAGGTQGGDALGW
jgi:hypothetical protein